MRASLHSLQTEYSVRAGQVSSGLAHACVEGINTTHAFYSRCSQIACVTALSHAKRSTDAEPLQAEQRIPAIL